jgi:hypothetical protein
METTCYSESLVDFQRTTQCCIPEDNSSSKMRSCTSFVLKYKCIDMINWAVWYNVQVRPTRMAWARHVLWQCGLGRALLCSIEKKICTWRCQGLITDENKLRLWTKLVIRAVSQWCITCATVPCFRVQSSSNCPRGIAPHVAPGRW